MPRLTLNQTNFTAGEISPRMYGRTDVDRYANAAKRMINAHPVIHGGAVRRAGTRFAKETKTSSKKSRLIEFVYSKNLSFQLEFGDFYVRVFAQDGVYMNIELPTLYSEAMVADLDYAERSDAMFLFHPLVPVQRIRRFSNASWDFSAVPFTTQPFDEQGLTPAVSLTLSALSGTITATASAPVFLASDVGRILSSLAGIGTITGYTSTTVVTVTVTNPFLSLVLASGAWNMDASPQTTVTASAVGPVGASITLTLGAAGWRSTDVGNFVRVNGGTVKITGFTSDTIVTGTVMSVLSAATAAPALSWTLEAPVWNAANGYPCTGTFFQQRLWVAGSPRYPQTIWGSKTALIYDFTRGVNDSDACNFTIDSDEKNPILFLVANQTILINTFGGELVMIGGNEKPITPTNVQIKPQTGYGCKAVRPIKVGKESLFIQKSGRKVRAMSYVYQSDGYDAQNLTVFAEHITRTGVVAMAYQQDPDQLLWIVLGDGSLVSCTLDREQQVNGWAHHYTDGAFESVSTIPTATQDQVWVIVRRTIGGVTKRYVEYLDSTFQPMYPGAVDPLVFPTSEDDDVITYGCTVDSGLVFDNVAGQSTFTGLNHLEGKTVDVVADGSPMPTEVVTGGSITISRASKRTLIGLHFRNEIKLLTPEVNIGTGSAQGNSMSTREVTMRFLNTVGAQVFDGDGKESDVPFRYLGPDVLDQPPPLFSGLIRIETLGWERGRSEITIVQDQPLPMHLQSVIRKITIND